MGVLGAGSWGTALAMLLARNGYRTFLWGHTASSMEKMAHSRCNDRYLPGLFFPSSLHVTHELQDVLSNASTLLVAVPSEAFRNVLEQIRPMLNESHRLFWATKGLELDSGKLMHEVFFEVLGKDRDAAVLSGPSFAKEVAENLPTAITIASYSKQFAENLMRFFHSETFRVYTSDDIVGVELGGATKNVFAIAAGISDGLGFGANARAALMTRAVAEMIRLGSALGGRRDTFMGLAGVGDLILTCTDDQSRNRRLGLALGKGMSLQAALAEIGQTVEGIQTAHEVYLKAQAMGIDMPITAQVYAVLYEQRSPRQAVQYLLERSQKREMS